MKGIHSLDTKEVIKKECYQCNELVYELSPRSRCVKCEWMRGEFNEAGNDSLRSIIVKLEKIIQKELL